MRPGHPTYRWLWLALHGGGVVACHVWGVWDWYYGLVALLEGIAIARQFKGRTADGTWSWFTWRFLEQGDGRLAFLRATLVGAWTIWFVVGFALHGWFPSESVNAFCALAFQTWLWRHFFIHRSSSPRGAARASNKRPDTED